MIVSGTIYGVVLNDRDERAQLAESFEGKPYGAPPRAPVVYIKPRPCVTRHSVAIPAGAGEIELAPTIALLFARDACKVDARDAMATVGAACIALDVSIAQDSYYRPAVAQRTLDGFLPLGTWAAPVIPDVIETKIDGAVAHRWSLDRLERSIPDLIAELSQFMTLRAGDVLLVGLPGDAPRVRGGHAVAVSAPGLPILEIAIEENPA